MTKDEMTTLLRSVGCDENTVIAMTNAYEMGAEYEIGRILAVIGENECECQCADVVRDRGYK